MISAALALELRAAGLAWQPAERDCFTIPGGEFDGHIFSLHEQPALIELLHGQPAITFHGSSEWALDHVMTSEVVWLPTETQLRERLSRLLEYPERIELVRTRAGFRCTAGAHSVEAADAESAYALTLIALLRERNG